MVQTRTDARCGTTIPAQLKAGSDAATIGKAVCRAVTDADHFAHEMLTSACSRLSSAGQGPTLRRLRRPKPMTMVCPAVVRAPAWDAVLCIAVDRPTF